MYLKEFSEKRIFVDSNIFIYASSQDHPLKHGCKDFLLKVKEGEIFGFINGRIVDEVFHKLLMAEISNKYKIKLRDALTYTKVNPEVLKKFQTPRSITEDILDFDVSRF